MLAHTVLIWVGVGVGGWVGVFCVHVCVWRVCIANMLMCSWCECMCVCACAVHVHVQCMCVHAAHVYIYMLTSLYVHGICVLWCMLHVAIYGALKR